MNSDQLAADVVEVLEQERDALKALLLEARAVLNECSGRLEHIPSGNVVSTEEVVQSLLTKLKDIS